MKDENLKTFFFNNSISSFIRQDTILSVFDLGKNINNYILLLDLDNGWFTPINKNNLIIDESLLEFKEQYFNSIKFTLAQYIQVDD